MKNFRKTGVPHDSRARYKYYPAELGAMVRLLVSYGEGGRNYSTGAVDPRGISMSLTSMTVSKCAKTGLVIESSEMYSGTNGRIMLLETARYSAKKLEEIVERLDPHAPEISAMWGIDPQLAEDLVSRVINGEQRQAA